MVTVAEIAEAHSALRGVVHCAPLPTCESITERCGLPAGSLLFKMENLQRTGSLFMGNMITVLHNRVSPSVSLGRTGVELLLEVRDAEHVERIRKGLMDRRYHVEMLKTVRKTGCRTETTRPS